MADILHDTYDILKKIGSGSGGVVYLAQHKRLNKLVVIKEDKRRISVAPGAVSGYADSQAPLKAGRPKRLPPLEKTALPV